MIRKLIFKYSLAAHLGLLAAFPIAALPFLSADALGKALLWLTLISAIWIFAEPAVLIGERSAQARQRTFHAILSDPLFYFFVLAVAFALVRHLNSGIQLGYAVEEKAWLVKAPPAPVLPASVAGAGFLPLVSTLALGVFTLGVRNALGAAGRVFCGLTAVSVAGAAGLVAGTLACTGASPALADAFKCNFLDSPYLGGAFGFCMLLAVLLGVDAERRKWAAARLPFVIAVAGGATGLVFFAPPYVTCVFLAVTLVFAIFALVFCARAGSMSGFARALVFLIIALAVPAILLTGLAPAEFQQYKLQGLDPAAAFPVEYARLTGVHARISKAMWLEHPWVGAGEGAYGLQLPFIATNEDWMFLPPHPENAIAGFWTLIAERGIVGCALLAVGLGMLVWAWGARLAEAFKYLRGNDDADTFLFACPPVVWVAPVIVVLALAEFFFSSSFRSIACVFAYVVPLALSGASFPRKPVSVPVKESASSVQNQGK